MFLLQRIFFILSHTLSNTPTHSLSFSNTCHALKLSQVYTLYLYLSISLTQNTICLSQLYTNKQFQNTISCVLPRYLPTYTYLSSNSFSHSLSFSLYHETQTLFLSLSLSLSLSPCLSFLRNQIQVEMWKERRNERKGIKLIKNCSKNRRKQRETNFLIFGPVYSVKRQRISGFETISIVH